MITNPQEIARIVAGKSRRYFQRNPDSGKWGGLFPEQSIAHHAMTLRGMEPTGQDIFPCVVEHLKLRGEIPGSTQILGRRYKRNGADGRDTAITRVVAFWKK
jgi:hypothetical protein